MADFKAEIRIKIDNSSTGDIYHQGYSINENERAKAHAEVFTIAPSGEYDVCFDNLIKDISIFSNTESQLIIKINSLTLAPISFIEHFSIQSTEINDITIKNISSVTGTYRLFIGGKQLV